MELPCCAITLSTRGWKKWQALITNSGVKRVCHYSVILCSKVTKLAIPLELQTARQSGSHAMKSRGFRSGECAG